MPRAPYPQTMRTSAEIPQNNSRSHFGQCTFRRNSYKRAIWQYLWPRSWSLEPGSWSRRGRAGPAGGPRPAPPRPPSGRGALKPRGGVPGPAAPPSMAAPVGAAPSCWVRLQKSSRFAYGCLSNMPFLSWPANTNFIGILLFWFSRYRALLTFMEFSFITIFTCNNFTMYFLY